MLVTINNILQFSKGRSDKLRDYLYLCRLSYNNHMCAHMLVHTHTHTHTGQSQSLFLYLHHWVDLQMRRLVLDLRSIMPKVIVNTGSMRKNLAHLDLVTARSQRDLSSTTLPGLSVYLLHISTRMSHWHWTCLHVQDGTGHLSLSPLSFSHPSFPFSVNITFFPDSGKQIGYQFLYLPCPLHSTNPLASSAEMTLICAFLLSSFSLSFLPPQQMQ